MKGSVYYMKKKMMTKAKRFFGNGLAVLAAAALLAATPASAFADDSNESVIFHYLTETAGYNSAAACGIMGNLYQECRFDPAISSTGSTYYGLVQWGSWRKTALFDYCNENGYDYSSLEGQLHYLELELNDSYSDVGDYLRNVPNTSEGAYEAADYFCRYFEICGNYSWEVPTRGGFAQSFYETYGRGNGTDEVVPEEEVEEAA